MRGGYGCPFCFTKSIVLKLKILDKTIAILLMPTFLASSVPKRPFSAPLTCDAGYDVEVYAVAAVLYSEARGESQAGRLAVVHAIVNRSEKYKESILETTRRGMRSGKLDPKLVEEASWMLKTRVGHSYCHWIAFGAATDLDWVGYAKRQSGLWVGGHFFF
jgi:hypothetical protein